MKREIIVLFLLCLGNSLISQSSKEVAVINIEDSIQISDSELLAQISIKRKFFKKSLKDLTKQAIDSTILYGGNCMKITYHDSNSDNAITNWKFPDYLRANLYRVGKDQLESISQVVRVNQLQRDSVLRNRRTSKDFEVVFGLQYSQFTLKKNTGYITEGGDGGSLNFFLHFNRGFQSNKTSRLKYIVGVGIAREYMSFYPLVTLAEANISTSDNIRVGEVNNWEYQLLLPVSISYEFPNLFKIGHGLRFIAGVENRFRVHRVNTLSILVENYNFEENIGDFYENESLMSKANELYTDFINPYSLQFNCGIALLTPTFGSGGIRLTNMLISPFGKNQRIESQFGVILFIQVPLFDH